MAARHGPTVWLPCMAALHDRTGSRENPGPGEAGTVTSPSHTVSHSSNIFTASHFSSQSPWGGLGGDFIPTPEEETV